MTLYAPILYLTHLQVLILDAGYIFSVSPPSHIINTTGGMISGVIAQAIQHFDHHYMVAMFVCAN